MKSTIQDRLHQMRQAGVTDSAEALRGHVGAKGTDRAAAKLKAAATPDSPRDVHGGPAKGSQDDLAAAAAATSGAARHGIETTPAQLTAPLSVRGKLVAAKVVLEQRRDSLKQQLHTAERLLQHTSAQLEDGQGHAQMGRLAEVFKLSGPSDGSGGLLGRPHGGKPGDVVRLSDVGQVADHLSSSMLSQLGGPVASWSQKIDANSLHLRHLTGLLGLQDHELNNLAATHAALPSRLSQVEAQVGADQEAMVAASMHGEPAHALSRKVFAGRQEFVRLNEAFEGLKGLRSLVDG